MSSMPICWFIREDRMQLLQNSPAITLKAMYLFKRPEAHLIPVTYQDLFKRELKAAGITDANFHSLRHTFATRAIENGMDILVLSRILGHAKPSTTLNMYGHVLTEHRTESMQKISSLYKPAQTPKPTEQATLQEDQKNSGPILQF